MSSFNQKPHHSIKKIILLSSKPQSTRFDRVQSISKFQRTFISIYIYKHVDSNTNYRYMTKYSCVKCKKDEFLFIVHVSGSARRARRILSR